MNFQDLHPVESPKQLLEITFRKAREKISQKIFKGDWQETNKKRTTAKLDLMNEILVSRLQGIVRQFPSERGLPPFYLQLMHLTLEYPLYKKSLGAVHWAEQKVHFFHREYVRKINRSRDSSLIAGFSKESYGRISSVIKQIEPNLKYLEQCRIIMKTYPDIKEMFTICIYGFPNVGKTTLLNKLTGSKAKVAAYAFTTQTINSGFMTINGQKIQVLDVPGTLAREDKMNPIELQAELVRKELANIIIYVFDLSGYSGYSLAKQEQLLQKLGKEKNILIYLAKQDLAEKEVMEQFKYPYYSLPELEQELGKLIKKERF